MTPFPAAVQAVRKLYPRMRETRAGVVVRAVLDAVTADQGRAVPKCIGKSAAAAIKAYIKEGGRYAGLAWAPRRVG